MTPTRFDLERAPLDEGTVLLEASAGTGKTYTLTGILLRLLLEGVVERLDQVLVVTFTVAATDELKNRLRAGLLRALSVCEGNPDRDPFFAGLARHAEKGARILRAALETFDDVAVATIHGFCKRLLDEAAFESQEPFVLELAVDESPLWQLAAEDALRLLRANDSLMLGALQHKAGFDPDALVQLYRLWQRHSDVQLDPAEPLTKVHVAVLCSAVHTAARHFDEAAVEQIRNFQWKAGQRALPEDPTFALQHLGQLLADKPELALPQLCDFARSNLADALYKKSQRLDHAFFTHCDQVLSALQTAAKHLRSELLLAMHSRLQQQKRQDRVLVFQDLLSRTHAALHDPARSRGLLQVVRQRHRVGLIDEFQDTDSLQYGIFATCFHNRPLFLVGDPKQSIYGFRGADLRTYLAARDDAVLERTLDVNFRSSPDVVAAVNQLFARRNAFVTEDIRLHPVKPGPASLQVEGDPGAVLRWRFVPPPPEDLHKTGFWPGDVSEPLIAADVAAEISRLLRSGLTLDGEVLQPRHVAVLTRTNRQATVVQDTLRRAGIVSAIGKAGDVFDTEELVEVERIMLALLRPNDVQRARAAMATRLWGLDAAALHALEADDSALEREMQRLEYWRQLWLGLGFVVMKEHMLVGLQTQTRLLAMPGGERRLTNYQQLFEMLHQAEHEHRLSPEGLFQWLQHERRHQDEIDYQRRELRLESDDDAVQILTVHGSKGLQYEIVFCPFLWDGRRAPAKSAIVEREGGRRLGFDLAKDDPGWLRNEGERLAEDVRLCYVALTRSRRRCYVHWGCLGSHTSGAWLSSLGWLLRPNAPDTSVPNWPIKWSDACKTDAPSFGAQLRGFADRSNGTMSVEDVPEAPVVVPVPATTAPPLRAVRVATRTHRAMAVHSFTSLTAGATVAQVPRDVADPAVPASPAPESRGIFGFRRGTAAGQCLHEIIEHIDLQALGAPAAEELVRTKLRQCGLADASAHPGTVDPIADVLDNLRHLRAARVHEGGPTIGALCSGQRQAEWQFMLPTRAELRGLAELFARHGGDIARTYAARLETLSERTLDGFLVGFVDLVAEHDGRYWVIDWKSNHLGHQASDYGPDAVLQAMIEHDYVLQYHLYVLALHRQLRARLPDYDAARHLGGVCYAFLRGASAGATTGMFFDRPAPDLVNAMDRWVSEPAGGSSA
ncbi:MAG TPA: exodeoxyribonuclease V subunit beta [Planctomycetota bacterium]|nr:exodeoxyribonuclease V subunit beta [Planctomycetota bacterium]